MAMIVEKIDTGRLKYLIRYPDGYKKGDRCPVIFLLHGAGSRGDSLDNLLKNVYFPKTEKHKEFPFVTVAPLCGSDKVWYDYSTELKELLHSVVTADYADPARIYVMGPSMGGYGTWYIAMCCAELIAAIVPICGGGMYWNAYRLKNVPVWAHHGELDDTVLPRESVIMVERVNAAGGNAKLTLYPDIAHPSWVPVYENYEVFEWLLSHRNDNSGEVVSSNYDDIKKYG